MERGSQVAGCRRAEAQWIADRIADDCLFVIEGLCRVDVIDGNQGGIQQTVQSALRIMHDHAVHPWSVHQELSALLNALNSKPTAAAVAAEASIEATWRAKEMVQGAWRMRFPRE